MADATTPEIPDITEALPAMWPELRAVTWKGWAGVVALSVVSLVIISLIGFSDRDRTKGSLIVLAIGGVLIGVVFSYVRRRHVALIMPFLAKTAGYGYQQDARYFLKTLPTRLLPKGGVQRAEDLLSGRIGDRAIQFAEAQIETGGKNSRTLFKGVVMQFPNLVEMPAFFVAAEDKTKGGFLSRADIKVDDLVQVRSLSGRTGINYGVWSSSVQAAQMPGVEAVLNILTGLEGTVGYGATLFTASCDKVVTHVAISHNRDLFRMGGLFTNRDDLMQEIRMAYHDLTLPMRLVSSLLQAEAEVAKAAAQPTGGLPSGA